MSNDNRRTVENGSIRNNMELPLSGRIAAAFERRREKGRKTLITFVTAGDPDIGTTERLVDTMISEGADLVELGIPYSDPIAEGPVIQAANERALMHGIRMADVFSLVGRLRTRSEVPLVLLLYVNVIVQYGADRFFGECRQVGIDGVIVPDLPYEERAEIEPDARRHGIALIRMVSPVSEERIEMIATGAEGFLYCVSSLGVTGTRSGFETDFARFFQTINRASRIPTALGFGISNGAQVREIRQWADGVIVGSAMVRAIAEEVTPEARLSRCAAFTRELRRALDEE